MKILLVQRGRSSARKVSLQRSLRGTKSDPRKWNYRVLKGQTKLGGLTGWKSALKYKTFAL